MFVKKLREPVAFLVFMSGYTPLALILAALDFNPQHKYYFDHYWMHWGIVALFGCSVIFTRWHFKKYRKGEPMEVVEIEARSGDLLNYCIPYIAGFAGVAVGDPGQMVALFAILLTIFHVTYKTQSVIVNPFLAELGYNLYTATLKMEGGDSVRATVVSKEVLYSGSRCRLVNIANAYYIHVQKKPEPGRNNVREELPRTSEGDPVARL